MDSESTDSLPMKQRLEDKLRSSLKIEHLEIVDTSDFAKKMTLARHKMINQLLAEEIAILHAFSQKTLTPEQWKAEKAKG